MKHSINCKETGELIELFNNLNEAKKALIVYETSDKKEGIFISDFYEIKEIKESKTKDYLTIALIITIALFIENIIK